MPKPFISCIIAAYNEKTRIGDVLRVAAAYSFIDEIIVVDDGSYDGTAEFVRAHFKNVKLIVQPKNAGKSSAVYAGMKKASGDFIFLLDADLLNLETKDLDDLLRPVVTGAADVSISLRGNSPRFWCLIGLDFISGERVFPKAIISKDMAKLMCLPRFGLEVFLNNIIILHKCRISIVRWPNVLSPPKYKKYGVWNGVKADFFMLFDIIRTVSFFTIMRQIIALRALRTR